MRFNEPIKFTLAFDWIALPMGCLNMKRYNAEGLYKLGRAMGPLIGFDDTRPTGLPFIDLVWATMALDIIVKSAHLDISEGTFNCAARLKDAINACLQDYPKALDSGKSPIESYGPRIKGLAEEFETLFAGECMSLNIFSVGDILAYQPRKLIEEGEWIIPADMRALLSDNVREDVRAATRCMAFELPTACAFHMARATEGTMRDLHVRLIGPLPSTYQQRTFGSLITAFKTASLNPNLVSMLTVVKDNYRNPISHPELTLGVDESHEILGAYVAAIVGMLNEIKRKVT